jgi:hypothetical protein
MNSLLKRQVTRTEFSNGYTASMVYFPGTEEHEVAVFIGDKICYTTPVTNDVVRCLTINDAWDIVTEIMNLPNIDGISRHIGPMGTA